MHGRLSRHMLAAAVLSVVAFPLIPLTAGADMFHHTSHADLTPIGDGPLQSAPSTTSIPKA